MQTMSMAILVIASTLIVLFQNPGSTEDTSLTSTLSIHDENAVWNERAVRWLLDAQSKNGGWGAGSHSYQNVRNPHDVQTDPATTAFAAMALLKAGGPLKENPYRPQIEKALEHILDDIDQRPDNGRITKLNGTQPQVKLGINIDASMALQFITEMRDQSEDKALIYRLDEAANICIQLIEKSQNADGGWAGGGWAPVLQSAMANNALERAQARYDVDEKVINASREYQAGNMTTDGVRAEDAAGVPLYAVASAQRASSAGVKEVELLLGPGTLAGYSGGKIKKDAIVRDLEAKGVDKGKAERLANDFAVNQTATKALADDQIWEGFGNNGGEEYLSYMMTSEAIAQQGNDAWLKWRQSIEPKFKQSQNQNGSWSGHHCITSPVFCTAAIVQAWYGSVASVD